MLTYVAPIYKSAKQSYDLLWRDQDLSSEEGRSAERYRRALMASSVAAFSRIISFSTGLISVPLTLRYLGQERYGLWLTISSLIACLAFSDLGINNSLMNGISSAHGKDDNALAQRYISSALLFLATIATALALLFALSYHWIPWERLTNIKSPRALAEVAPSAAAFVLCFLINVPLGVTTKVQSGYQEGFSQNLWLLAGNIAGFLGLLLAVSLHASLPVLVLAVSGPPNVVLLANGAYLFGWRHPFLRPTWESCSLPTIKGLARSGFLFLVLQLAYVLSFTSDNVVIAQVLGPKAVAQYGVVAKLFSVVPIMTGILSAPLWPAYGEALSRADYQWARKTLLRSTILVGALSLAIGVPLTVFAPRILHLWVGHEIVASPTLLIGLATWGVIFSVSASIAAFLNAASIVMFQVVLACISCPSNLALSVYLTERVGPAGVVYGSIITQTIIILIPCSFFLRSYLARMADSPAKHNQQTELINT